MSEKPMTTFETMLRVAMWYRRYTEALEEMGGTPLAQDIEALAIITAALSSGEQPAPPPPGEEELTPKGKKLCKDLDRIIDILEEPDLAPPPPAKVSRRRLAKYCEHEGDFYDLVDYLREQGIDVAEEEGE